ncbi:PEP-CTERM sorting domain-containing protein [Massilia antarctica]|uniref:PEP-CTERM sorting domain-containing protein n=2 Tax=Massilia antarctica TaxID=2765360 RepID=A0AA49AAU6_9BURK|nr:PEP-CTERM sorting domain-containing protein [Massilia antarctica]
MHSETHANAVAGQLSSDVSTWQTLRFTLSPSTRLSFSAQADTFVQEEGITQSRALAGIGGSLDTIINGVVGQQEFSTNLRSSDGMRNRFLHGQFETGTAGGTGQLHASTSSSLYHYPSTVPVPEPETYGMLMAGLLVVGSIARRKARHKASKD